MDFKNVKKLGRCFECEGELWCAFSATGISFEFFGKKLEIKIKADKAFKSPENQARIAVYLDDERKFDFMLDEALKSIPIYEGEKKKMTVRVIKLSETAMSTFGISQIVTDEAAIIKPSEDKAHKIEFIGDSITSGYGVDDEVAEHHFKTATEDVTQAYAYKIINELKLDYSLVSISGYGIISGYTDDPEKKNPKETLPQYYESLGFSYQSFQDKIPPQTVKWDFNKFIPEAVVINLGTNDASYCKTKEKQEEYRDKYVEFLKRVRKNNPKAMLFSVLGIMDTLLIPSMKEAVEIYKKESGDDRIECFEFEIQDQSLGYVADFHPTKANHEKACRAFLPFLRKKMGW